MTENPLLKESSLDFHYPPFDQIKDEHFAPAYEQGMSDQLKEIEPIASNAEPPTFENTIVALEKTGNLLGRVDRIFSNLTSANTNPALQKVETEMAPKLAAQQDAIFLNGPLFKRIETLYNNREKLGLDEESTWLIERYYKDFVRAGAKLSDADKTKLKKMNAELAELQTKFSQNVLKEKNAGAIVVEKREELDGFSPTELAAASAAAKEEKKEGKFIIPLQNTTQQPALTNLKNRALRERIMTVSLARNSHGGEWDNRAVVLRMVKLRAERAALLGYANHAAYQLEDQTAHDVATVNKLLAQLAPPAVANARQEAADMQKLIDQEKGGFQLASWDWAFYSEKVRQARYAFDEAEIKPYFELNHVLIDGVFYAATQLYGITFKERNDLPVYQSDVRVFEVFDKDGKPLALFLVDYYARPSKTRRRLDERIRQPKRIVRHEAGGRESPQHSETGSRPAHPAHLRRSADGVPRVRPRAPRHVFAREISALQRDERAARFRRVSVAGQRDVGDLAGSAAALREALPDRRADAEGAARQGAGARKNSTRASKRPNTSPPRCSTRPGTS